MWRAWINDSNLSCFHHDFILFFTIRKDEGNEAIPRSIKWRCYSFVLVVLVLFLLFYDILSLMSTTDICCLVSPCLKTTSQHTKHRAERTLVGSLQKLVNLLFQVIWHFSSCCVCNHFQGSGRNTVWATGFPLEIWPHKKDLEARVIWLVQL